MLRARCGPGRLGDDPRLRTDAGRDDLRQVAALHVRVVPCDHADHSGAVLDHRYGRVSVLLESYREGRAVRYPGAVDAVPDAVVRYREGVAVAVAHLGVRLLRIAGVQALRPEEEPLIAVHLDEPVPCGVLLPDQVPEPVQAAAGGGPLQDGVVGMAGVDGLRERAGEDKEPCGRGRACGDVAQERIPQGVGVHDPDVLYPAVPQRGGDLLHIVRLVELLRAHGDLHVAVVRRVGLVVIDVEAVHDRMGAVVGDDDIVVLGAGRRYREGHRSPVDRRVRGEVGVVGRVDHGLAGHEDGDYGQGHRYQRQVGALLAQIRHLPYAISCL